MLSRIKTVSLSSSKLREENYSYIVEVREAWEEKEELKLATFTPSLLECLKSPCNIIDYISLDGDQSNNSANCYNVADMTKVYDAVQQLTDMSQIIFWS